MQSYGRKPFRLLQVERTTSIQARHQPGKDDRTCKDSPRKAPHAWLQMDGCIYQDQRAYRHKRELCLQMLQVPRHQVRDPASGTL